MTGSTVTWEAPEFEYFEKGVSWYWISIIIAALIIAFSVWEQNFLFGLFIVIAEVLLILWGNREPRVLPFSLNASEITIGEHKMHSLKEFESWSMDNRGDGWMEMNLMFKARLKIPLKIFAPEEIMPDIRAMLKPVLRETEHQTSLLESIERLIRF